MRSKRRYARELALQFFYSLELTNDDFQKLKESFWKERKKVNSSIKEFAERLIVGTWENISQIDSQISQHLENWRFDRLSVIDRNILRLATFEILFCMDISRAVTINEALELAKQYSSDDSPRFINGVLDKIGRINYKDGRTFI